jgi:hypothetical protein
MNMGCDIHCYTEVRKYRYDDKERKHGVWINADKWSVNPGYYLYDEEKKWHVDIDDSVLWARHYALFAVLADVRNYWNIKPISQPKGLPDDVSPEVAAEADYWGTDGHSHSWLTLRELEALPLSHYVPDDMPLALLEDWNRLLDELRQRAKEFSVSSDDIRIVFWFDN